VRPHRLSEHVQSVSEKHRRQTPRIPLSTRSCDCTRAREAAAECAVRSSGTKARPAAETASSAITSSTLCGAMIGTSTPRRCPRDANITRSCSTPCHSAAPSTAHTRRTPRARSADHSDSAVMPTEDTRRARRCSRTQAYRPPRLASVRSCSHRVAELDAELNESRGRDGDEESATRRLFAGRVLSASPSPSPSLSLSIILGGAVSHR